MFIRKKKTYRKRTTKRVPRKYYGKKRYTSQRRVTEGIPDSKFTKLRYIDSGNSLTSNVITTASLLPTHSRVFSLNNPRDPNYNVDSSDIGPTYWGFWASQYYCSTCVAVKFHTEVWNTSAFPMRVCLTFTNGAPDLAFPSGTDFRVIEQNRWSQVKTLGPVGSGTPKCSFTKYFPLRKLFGITKQKIMDDPSYQSQNNANGTPSNQMFATVWGVPLQSNPTVNSTWIVRTYITYYVKFFDRKVVNNIVTIDEADQGEVSPIDNTGYINTA